MKEDNAYILGTDKEELHRLGIQHQVWASEAQKGWELAGFTSGNTILDLGCGPGFCTKELAFITGEHGKVIGVDKSEHFINFLSAIKDQYGLNIDAICNDFNDLTLEPNSLDGIYCRWALAWIPNPEEVLHTLKKALKPGGKMVIQEYYDWTTHQTVPEFPALTKAIQACIKSFEKQEGDIDVGRNLSELFKSMGMQISNQRVMVKMATPDSFVWQWPKSFYFSYYPRLVDLGYLTNDEMKCALHDMKLLEQNKNATIFCPTLIEVIAQKID